MLGKVVNFTDPLTLYLGIDFDPLLSNEKRVALRTSNYASSTKVILVFDKAFWEQDPNRRRGGKTITDLKLQIIYYPSYNMSNTGLAVLLASYTWGGNSKALQAMTDQEVVDQCLEEVALAHRKPLEEIRRHFVRGVVKHWGLDRYSKGGFLFSQAYHVCRHTLYTYKCTL